YSVSMSGTTSLHGARPIYQQNFQSAAHLLTRERYRGHQCRNERKHQRYEARYEEVYALQRGVVSHARLHRNGKAPWRQTAGSPYSSPREFTVVGIDHGARISLTGACGVGITGIRDQLKASRGSGCQALRKPGAEHQRNIRLTTPEQRLNVIDGLRDACHDEAAVAFEAGAQSPRCMINFRLHEHDTNIVHIATQGEAEHDYLGERDEQENPERLPVAEDVPDLLSHEGEEGGAPDIHDTFPLPDPESVPTPAPAPTVSSDDGRVRRTHRSSRDATLNARFRSLGVPMAAMRPPTMIDTRSQYSASSR